MAGLTLDAGVLIAAERRDRRVEAWIAEAADRAVPVSVLATTVAEVWRGGPRAALLVRLLGLCRVQGVDEELARSAGRLLGATGSAATLDALVVASAARRGDLVLSGDASDIPPLAGHAGVRFALL